MEYLRNHPFATWLCLTLAGVFSAAGAIWSVSQRSMLFIVFGILCLVILGVRDMFHYSSRQSERTRRLGLRAGELGFDFQELAPFNVFGWSRSFKLTRRAFAFQPSDNDSRLFSRIVSLAMPKARNVMQRSGEEARLALFDYEFSDNDVTYNQATAAIQAPCLDHPYFALFPANVWQKLSTGFREEPTVHGRHRLITESPISPTAVATIADSLDANTTLEVGEGYLLLYRSDRRPLKPDDIETKISQAMRVYAAICQALALN